MQTYEKFGKLLAGELNKDIADFDHLFSEGYFKIDKVSALKEWAYFNMFMVFQGISAYFKNIDEHKGHRLIDAFHDACWDIFANNGIFANSDEFMEMLLLRYAAYSNALKDSRKPNPLHWLGKEFCKRCGYEEGLNPRIIMFAITLFTRVSIANKNFLKSISIEKQL